MRTIILLLTAFISTLCFSQVSIGVIAEPTINLTNIGPTPGDESDSLISIKTRDYTLGVGIEIRTQLDRYSSISFIPGYSQSNMLLEKSNLNFLDIVHPLLPEIRDLTQGTSKKAYLHYRFAYLGTQVLYSRNIKVKVKDNRFGVEAGGGLGLYFLIKDDLKIRTEGFAIKSEFTHIFDDSTGVEAGPILVNAIANADIFYKVQPDFHVLAGVKLVAPFTSASSSMPKVTIFTPALRLGFRYLL